MNNKISEQKVRLLLGSLGVLFVNRSYGMATTTTITLDAFNKAFQMVIDNPSMILEDVTSEKH